MLMELYGSLFFLGIFLGILFLMATILIMYYKQLSEGYEDQKRFEIMQKVGMSAKEVKQTIRSQVLIFFFLPLTCCSHSHGFCFPFDYFDVWLYCFEWYRGVYYMYAHLRHYRGDCLCDRLLSLHQEHIIVLLRIKGR